MQRSMERAVNVERFWAGYKKKKKKKKLGAFAGRARVLLSRRSPEAAEEV
jgi:hypothetical protein